MSEIQVETVREGMLSEVREALGFKEKGIQTSIFNTIARLPSAKLARILADLENDVHRFGFNIAARNQLPFFTKSVEINGRENVPEEGPLLVISNHPGTIDALLIASQMPRSDIKIVARNMPFVSNLPSTNQHMIFSTLDTMDRMSVVRNVIRHLMGGGMVILFPGGRLDPDPETMPEAEHAIENWSPSVELILKKVPDTLLQITIVSGLIKRSSIKHPITYIRKDKYKQHALGETVQMIRHLLFSRRNRVAPHITFGNPVTFEELVSESKGIRLTQSIIDRAQSVLSDHMEFLQSNFSRG